MARPPRGAAGLRSISDILTDIAQSDELPEEQRRSIRKGQGYNPMCPCPECMRAYLASVEAKGEPA